MHLARQMANNKDNIRFRCCGLATYRHIYNAHIENTFICLRSAGHLVRPLLSLMLDVPTLFEIREINQ